jgi:hypothetical protein
MMNPEALLINRPAIDFGVFLGVSHKILGYSPAAPSDQSHRELADAERFLSCLAALRDPKATPGLPPKLLTHVSFSALVVADERDLLDILEGCAGMPFVVADTLARGVQAAVISGTLAQWRDAVKSGSSPDAEPSVRLCFNKIHSLFCAEGLNVWTDFRTHEAPDRVTFYLEDKRPR